MLVLSNVFSLSLTGILATSGLLTVIVGLAIQHNLSNIFSGIFLNIEQPFTSNDWVSIDDITGVVIDISWRSTRLRNFKNTEVIIPNEAVANAKIINWNRTDKDFMCEGYVTFLTLSFHPHHNPEHIMQLLYDALKVVKPVDGREQLDLNWVKFAGVDAYGLKFVVAFDCINRKLKFSQQSVVLLAVHKIMTHAGITMTTGYLKSHISEDVGLESLASKKITTTDLKTVTSDQVQGNIYNESIKNQVLLSRVPLFAALQTAQIQLISENSEKLHVNSDYQVIKQGDKDNRLFIIADGTVSIQLNKSDKEKVELARMGVGEFFGEMSLMTGEPRSANVISLRPSSFLIVQKETIQTILSQNQESADIMAKILAERQLSLQKAIMSPKEKSKAITRLTTKIKQLIHNFFS